MRRAWDQAQQRSEDALALESGVPFRQLQRLVVRDFGRCVLTRVEGSVTQSGQRILERQRIGIDAEIWLR